MKWSIRSVALSVFVSAAAALAIANPNLAPATPSARMAIEMDVTPVEGKVGQFLVSSVVTDLETNTVIAKPRLIAGANKTAKIQTGNEGKWTLEIAITADSESRKGLYEATFTREGKVVSRQRLAMNL